MSYRSCYLTAHCSRFQSNYHRLINYFYLSALTHCHAFFKSIGGVRQCTFFRQKARSIISLNMLMLLGMSVQCWSGAESVGGQELPKQYGYLLINLDVGGTAPSIDYAKLSRYSDARSIKTIDLKGKEKGFMLLALPRGKYQIRRVNVPYFDLPYRVGTEKDINWQFIVEEGKVNYLGLLKINKSRKKRQVDVSLNNRIATDLPAIKGEFSELLELYPLVQGSMARDDFLLELGGGR